MVLGEEGRAVQGVEGPTMLSLTFTPMGESSKPEVATPMQTPAAATPATAPATGAAPHSHAGSSPLPSPTAFFDDGEDPALNDNDSTSKSMVAPPHPLVPLGGRAGIGIKCVAVDGWLVVKAVKPGSPSDRGGVRVGDKLVRKLPKFDLCRFGTLGERGVQSSTFAFIRGISNSMLPSRGAFLTRVLMTMVMMMVTMVMMMMMMMMMMTIVH